jgi:hypothetical protein
MQEIGDCKQYATVQKPVESTPQLPGSAAAPCAPRRVVVIEVFLLRCGPDGTLAFRQAWGWLDAAETPDDAAVRIGLPRAQGSLRAGALHSTSWRQGANGSIVLTYAVAPDPEPDLAAVALSSLRLAYGPSAGQPSPARVSAEQVAAHAVQHLAMVADTNPQVHEALSADGDFIRALAAAPRSTAGQLPT